MLLTENSFWAGWAKSTDFNSHLAEKKLIKYDFQKLVSQRKLNLLESIVWPCASPDYCLKESHLKQKRTRRCNPKSYWFLYAFSTRKQVRRRERSPNKWEEITKGEAETELRSREATGKRGKNFFTREFLCVTGFPGVLRAKGAH